MFNYVLIYSTYNVYIIRLVVNCRDIMLDFKEHQTQAQDSTVHPYFLSKNLEIYSFYGGFFG